MRFIGGIILTTIYFIRHAESDYTVRDSRIHPLTEKGLSDRHLVTEYLQDKNINAVLSSPYKRAVDTVSVFANKHDFNIETIEDFRELHSNNAAVKEEDFPLVMKRLWMDFNVKLSDGECLAEVQERNINALNEVLKKYKNKVRIQFPYNKKGSSNSDTNITCRNVRPSQAARKTSATGCKKWRIKPSQVLRVCLHWVVRHVGRIV
jgi:2,3-bisphosphoglycerate-dependent phosphoglycerate mutase